MAAGESFPGTLSDALSPAPGTTRQLRPETHPDLGGQAGSLPAQFGRYLIVRQLGRGGMGSVYLAHDTQLDRPVALKVPLLGPEDGRGVLERFYREARAAASLSHPNLCPVHDVGAVDGVPYLTMAYIEGTPLSARLERAGAGPGEPGNALPPVEAVALARQVALALEEAHRQGVIHRDLKPSNVMINRRGEPVVMDFGLARRRGTGEAQLTREGAVLGTPSYMAPEQVAGDVEAMGPGCDIYSLGVLLYEMLTGRLPFRGNLSTVLARILSEEPEPLTAHNPGLDPHLDALCRKALAKQPPERYGSMKEFADALAAWLEDRRPAAIAVAGPTLRLCQVEATPSASSRPSWRLPAALVGAALLAFGVGLAGYRARDHKAPPAPSRGAARQTEVQSPAPPEPPAERLRERPGARFRPAGPRLPPAVLLLMRRVATGPWVDPGTGEDAGRQGALADLRHLAPDRAVEALRRALDAQDPRVRAWAARELAREHSRE